MYQKEDPTDAAIKFLSCYCPVELVVLDELWSDLNDNFVAALDRIRTESCTSFVYTGNQTIEEGTEWVAGGPDRIHVHLAGWKPNARMRMFLRQVERDLPLPERSHLSSPPITERISELAGSGIGQILDHELRAESGIVIAVDDHRTICATPTKKLRSRSLETGANSTGTLDGELTGAQKRIRPVGLQHANRVEHSGLATAGRSDDEVEARERTGLKLVYPPKILDAKPAQEDVLASGSRRNQGRSPRQSERRRLIRHD